MSVGAPSRRSWPWLALATVAVAAGALWMAGSSRRASLVAFTDEAGGQVRLADFRGKVLLLNVWATWCLPCREEMPALDRLQEKLGGPEFQVVAVSVARGGPTAVRRFCAQVGVRNLPVFVDSSGAILQQAGATGLPTTVMFDRDGGEVGRFVGPAAWDGPAVADIVRNAIKRGKESGP